MTRSWIHITRGRFERQARVGLGELREEHLSRHGFAGPVAMLYRTDAPNEVVAYRGGLSPAAVSFIALRSLSLPSSVRSPTSPNKPRSAANELEIAPGCRDATFRFLLKRVQT
jgi:homogentisate 1,2-dioxygenase